MKSKREVVEEKYSYSKMTVAAELYKLVANNFVKIPNLSEVSRQFFEGLPAKSPESFVSMVVTYGSDGIFSGISKEALQEISKKLESSPLITTEDGKKFQAYLFGRIDLMNDIARESEQK